MTQAVQDLVAQMVADEEQDAVQYGVPGMKWGVRRALKNMPASARADYVKSIDQKWTDKVNQNPKLAKVSRIAARDAKRRTKKLKADYKARGLNIKRDSLARTRYDNELKVILDQSLEKAAYRVHKRSPSRLMEVSIYRHPDGSIDASLVPRTNAKIVKQRGQIARSDEKRKREAQRAAAREAKAAQAAADSKLSHAEGDSDELKDEDFENLTFRFVVDEEGFVDDILTPFDSLAHDAMDEELESVLMHYGVPGMKWGIRKRRGRGRAPAASTEPERVVIKKNPKTGNLETTGGANHRPSDDALKASAFRQKARASGTSSLSNAELKVLVERMNLEGSYAKLLAANTPPPKGAKAFLKKFVEEEGKSVIGGKKTKSQNIAELIIKGVAVNKSRKTKAAAKAAGTIAKRIAN